MAEKKEKRYVSDNAQLMATWNYEKNIELDINPKKITLGSHTKVWWKCLDGHEWQATIKDRNRGKGCPYCSGRYVIIGKNDLQTVNPILAKEWNYEKNVGLNPTDVMPNSNKKVWWKCNSGHEWQSSVSNRTKGNRCPFCSGKKVLITHNDLKIINPALAQEWNYEMNGTLRPENFTANSDKKVWWKCIEGHEWETSIGNRNRGSGCPYCAGRYATKGETDLKTINPTLAQEWNYEKNGELKPDNFTASSGQKVWWKCSRGHEWQATIHNRSKQRGCPFCNSEQNTSFPEYAIEYYLKKHNLNVIHSYKENGYELDIYIPSKNIAIEYDGCHWHKNRTKNDLEKNRKCKKDGIKLYRIREGLPTLNDSSIDYFVQKGQKELSKILEEVLSQIIGTKIAVDLEKDNIAIDNLRYYTEKANSLLHSNPQLVKEWNNEKNGSLKPENFTAQSNKKVWWKCTEGHEWQATIADRNRGRKCPYCAGKKVSNGFNDLKTVNPHLAKEWNYEKNTGLTPDDVTANSNKKVWWKCNSGHEWMAIIQNRNNGDKCPYCSGRIVIKGENDLKTINPTLAKEWNYEKNYRLTPTDVMPNSGKRVWWKCSKGHEWQARIADRNRGNKCPYCSNNKVLMGFNDLQTVNPHLAKEWNYKKNTSLLPVNVMPNSNKKVWWKCNKGHEWQAMISSRNIGRGCPECYKEKQKT